jgi:hypothetical protein
MLITSHNLNVGTLARHGGETAMANFHHQKPYVWVSLGNAMKAKQSKAKQLAPTHDQSTPTLSGFPSWHHDSDL